MRFSICMAAKNAESTIRDSIRSIIEQSFYDYELLIMDDGSTDMTTKIVGSFTDDRIKLISNPKEGLLFARIGLISSAIGEYIITVDSDDQLEKTALETIDAAIKASGADIVNYKGIKVKANGNRESLPDILPDNTMLRNEQLADIFDSLITNDKYTTLWNKAIKRKCIDLEGLSNCPNLTIGEDNIILLFTIPNASSYYYITNELYHYSVSSGVTKRFLSDSYSNHKKRIQCKVSAIKRAGLNLEKYKHDLSLLSIIEVAKICAYYPTKVSCDEYSKSAFHYCLEEIRRDDEFWSAYKEYNTQINMLYRIPLWLVKKRYERVSLWYKNVCASIRQR